jgi:hypothetical protein
VRLWRRRSEPRLRTLDEAECYGRAYGERSSEVRAVKLEPRRQRYPLRVSGEDLRQRFQERLDAREEPEPNA